MPSRGASLAIVGATGAVGRALLQALEDSDLELDELRLLASERGAGAELDFRGELQKVEALAEGTLQDLDGALFAATAEVSRTWAPRARAAGCAVVDLSPAFRLDPGVPLVVPELNAAALRGDGAGNLVAVPGPAAVSLALVLSPLHAAAGVERAVVTSCEAVSGAGQRGVQELEEQTRAMLGFQEPPPAEAVRHRIAFNLVPQVGSATPGGATDEERGAALETRRLLGPGAPVVTVTSIRVPLFYGHLQVVNVQLKRPLASEDARALLRVAPGVKVLDAVAEGIYPMPMLAVNDEAVLVGRIREDPSQQHGLDLVLASDNLRRGAAATALGALRVLLDRVSASR